MRLTVDLRFAGSPVALEDGDQLVTLDEIAAAGRSPRALIALLRGPRWERVRVLRDGRALNGIQAGALGLAALARTSRFEVVSPNRTLSLGASAMLARAMATFATAFPGEVAQVVRAERHAAAVARDRFRLPRNVTRPIGALTYLRSEPALRYKGAQVGGAAAHTAGVINGFAHAGVNVHVLAPEPLEGIEDVAFTDIRPERIFHLVHWLTLVDYSEQQVQAGLRVANGTDAVYQRYALGSYAGLELARRLDVPLILEFNGSEIWAEREWGSGRVKRAEVLTALERLHLRDASLLVVVSEVLKEQLVAEGIDDDRILVNPNGVDVDRLAFVRALSAPQWRERLGKPETPTVGFIGTFGPWHGVRVLPTIIDRVRAARGDVRWIVIGDGALFAEVAAEITRLGLSGVVELTGVVPHRNALELLGACDVCVSPHVDNPDGTRFFGSPTKLFEYMGLGKPIVASDLEQIGDVIEHERTGLLTPPGDADAAAQAVLRLLDDEPLRRRLGDAALEEARTTYSWDAHAKRILDAVVATPA
jgi:glycosyltransferase involved in cell wall biosynthesis